MIGNLYLWGNTGLYFISHFHYLGNDQATNPMIISVIPVSMCVISSVNPVGAYLMKRIHLKVLLIIASFILLSSLYIVSVTKNWYVFFFFQAVMFPTGVGLLYLPPVICSWEWHRENKGLITGLIIAGFGFGPLLFGVLIT